MRTNFLIKQCKLNYFVNSFIKFSLISISCNFRGRRRLAFQLCVLFCLSPGKRLECAHNGPLFDCLVISVSQLFEISFKALSRTCPRKFIGFQVMPTINSISILSACYPIGAVRDFLRFTRVWH